MSKGKVVLAYSGGLDTSVILKWLQEEGYSVICYIADVGQEEDFAAARDRAISLGAEKVFVEDLKRQFVTDYIFPAIKANAIYESRYLLGTSLARPCIAKRQVEIAEKEGANYVAHGATGKGNDQVRFELTYYALNPIFKQNGISMPSGDRPPYSMDENLMHISYESGDLEDPRAPGKEELYRKTGKMSQWADKPETVRIHFRDGTPICVENRESGEKVEDPLNLFLYLNKIACKHGIGRVDIVENRFVGIKSRGIYETPGATILRCAHIDIEGIAMDREVLRMRDMLSPKFSEILYYGFWFSPEMDFLLAAMNKAQELVDGWVDIVCYKGSCMATARESPTSLYSDKLASMEEVESYNPSDAGGFIRINAIRLRAHREILMKVDPERLKKYDIKGVTY
eukprot:jgi/Galph1/607/GphlegSOOS_G5425.1